MLSFEALVWLKSVDYGSRNHEERMALIKVAKILFPDEDRDNAQNKDEIPCITSIEYRRW